MKKLFIAVNGLVGVVLTLLGGSTVAVMLGEIPYFCLEDSSVDCGQVLYFTLLCAAAATTGLFQLWFAAYLIER